MYSVKRRLMVVLAAGFALLVVGAGLYISDRLSARVTEEFDAALTARMRALVSLTEQEVIKGKPRILLDYRPALMPEFERQERPDYFQFWLEDGTVVYRSRRMGKAQDLPRTATMTRTSIAPRDVVLPDGRAGRMVELAFRAHPDDDEDDDGEGPSTEPAEPAPAVILAVARGREGLDGLLSRMRWAIFGGGGVAIALAALLVWRSLAAGFKPIRSIADQVQRLDAENLSTSVRLARTPEELAPIIGQLNALLTRLDDSFHRERRFAGNVAHELRTPIAELRSLAEVGRRWPEDKDAIVRFFEDVNDIAGRMESVITNLLLLARCQAGVEKAVMESVDLRELLGAAWAPLALSAAQKELHFRLEMEEALVESDAGKLAMIFANLLGNAVHYALPRTEILCRGSAAGTGLRLEFANAAEPMSRTDLERLTEPFWRKDQARSSAEHSGLGLSVVCALGELLGLRVRFDQSPNGTFRAVLTGWAHKVLPEPSASP